jgi:DNA-directed RNA polymerase subunit RPC12/RpoP
MEIRKPNTECFVCKKQVYRRPSQLERFNTVACSRECLTKIQRTRGEIVCEYCGVKFFPKHSGKNTKTCSRSCSNRNRKGVVYNKKSQNNSKRRLAILTRAFGFSSCMIDDCVYNKTYDIHRLVKGKNGGVYEVGNMFAICPNHHAEVHRGLIELQKIDDHTLRVVTNSTEGQTNR